MQIQRRDFMMSALSTALATAIGGNAHAKSETLKNETDVVTKMTEAGYNHFILLNKRSSKLYLIQNGDFFFEVPVIFGRNEGHKNRTPSGIFSLTNAFMGASKPLMVFHHDERVAYLLHGVVPGREYALKLDNVAARKLSDGCINVPDEVLPYVLGFARQRAENHPQGLATPFVIIDDRYSPDRFQKSLSGFVPQKYNPD